MNIQKIIHFVLALTLVLLVTACGSGTTNTALPPTNAPIRPSAVPATSQPAATPTTAPTAVPPTVTATTAAVPTATAPTVVTPTTATADNSGFINGQVYLMSPPTPRMIVYALDPDTRVWAYVETNPVASGPVDFSIPVPPGSYQVFAFADDPNIHAYVGYGATDGPGLEKVTVAAGQSVADIVVRPPSAGNCGLAFGVPAAPDGRFAAVAGPSADCLATQVAGYKYTPLPLASCQLIQEGAAQAIKVNFTLYPDTPFADYTNGDQGRGCTLTATGTGADFSDPAKVMAKLKSAMVGWIEQIKYQAGGPTGAVTGLTSELGLLLIHVQWTPAKGVCPADQPISACKLTPEQKLYTIEIRVAHK
jgi:hypothetical protein